LLSLTSLLSTQTALAWTIDNFHLKGEIQTDGTILFAETIKADFSNNPLKHGIIREIPTQYEDENGDIFKTPITDIKVLGPNGEAHKFTQSRNGTNLSLRIGDANKYVNAEETYIIQYRISGVINPFEEHDELFWNVTGNEWDAPINKATAAIVLPSSSETFKTKCFTGPDGSTQQNCRTATNEGKIEARFVSDQKLNRGGGLTIVVGWDKNLVPIPERQMVFDLEGLFKKLQYLFLLFPVWALQRTLKIRNALKIKKAVIPLYHPPEGLGVGLIGFFDRGKPSTRDLTALITQLCVKGFFKIKEIPDTGVFRKNSYKITALDKKPSNLNKEERFVYDHIPLNSGESITLDELAKNKYSIFKYSNYQRLLKQIKLEVANYIRKNNIPPLKFLGLAFFGFFIFFGAIIFSVLSKSFISIICVIVGTIIALYLPKFNKEGQTIKHDIKGYKKFLKTADKQRINWSEAQNIFETNLPYAVALNLTDKWAKIFGDKIQSPEWYEGPNNLDFSRLERTMSTSAARSIRSSTPRSTPRSTSSSKGRSGFSRSSGGGRSGGGFGGGGGSSW